MLVLRSKKMKKHVLLFCLLFLAKSTLLGEFIPLTQYNKRSFEIGQIPDCYLFATYGILTAFNFQYSSEEELIENFNNLPVGEQYHIVYILSTLQKDKRIKEYFIPAYNTVRCRKKEKYFEEIFEKKSGVLQEIFITSLEKDSLKSTDFYEYANKVSLGIGSKKTEDEQLYIVSMLSLASHKKLINASPHEKEHIINNIISTTNRLTSHRAKTILTYHFIHLLTLEQILHLNTTEYALLLSIPKVLYHGKFVDFFPIYRNIIEHTDSKILKNIQIVDDLNFYFPGYNWSSVADAISIIKNNINNIYFDRKSRKYRISPPVNQK